MECEDDLGEGFQMEKRDRIRYEHVGTRERPDAVEWRAQRLWRVGWRLSKGNDWRVGVFCTLPSDSFCDKHVSLRPWTDKDI